MITGEKKLLRAWALYLPLGIRLQGAHEYTPPAINIAKLDIKTGAMDAPVPVDDGMEALSCSFKIYGYDVGMLTLLGLQAGLYSPEITVRQAYRVGNADSGQVETLQGMIVSITPDPRPATSLGEASVSVDISGQLGKDLAPTIREVTDDLAGWFKEGGVTRIRDYIEKDAVPALKSFGNNLWTIGKAISGLASTLIKYGFVSDERKDRREVLMSLSKTGSVDLARITAERKGQSEWFEQLLKDNPELPVSLRRTYTRTRGFIKNDDETFGREMEYYLDPEKRIEREPAALKHAPFSENPLSVLNYTPGRDVTMEVKPVYQIRADFSITQRPGEDGTQLAQRVTDNLGDINFGQRASMTDAYAGWDN